jgi:ABC-type glycerol-3-phosphate transport system substrate-binding protein
MHRKRTVAFGFAVIAILAATSIAVSAASGAGRAGRTAVKVMTIGYPDKDSTDPVTGVKVPGIGQLETAFEKANPSIDLQIINIPWGSGATSYSAKTDAMLQAADACLYEMPGAQVYGRQGKLVDLSTLIKKDKNFKNVWGATLDSSRSWGPKNPNSLFFIPNNTGVRVINWDAQLFKDYKVKPLSVHPTLKEIETKAAQLTGKDPVTGQQTYGYWYQGKYAVWQFMAIADAMGASWGGVNKKTGQISIKWNTPTYVKAMQWFVKMSKYAPAGALASDSMPDGFLTDQNVVAIIPEGEQGYFIAPLVANPNLRTRYRTSFNLRGPNGHGGVNTVSPLAMASNCNNKAAAWKALKWLAGAPEAETYYFQAAGRVPVTTGSWRKVPGLAALPDAKVIVGQPQQADPVYPWAAQDPRWALQSALEGALAGTVTPQQALQQAQDKTDQWVAQQKTGG